jgi:hypothetical protein
VPAIDVSISCPDRHQVGFAAGPKRPVLTLKYLSRPPISIMSRLQAALDSNDPAVFEVTRVVIGSILTDPSIEESIREAVANQKRLEAKQVMVEIETKNAEIEAIQAEGIAKANGIINMTLTSEYLQHELNLTLQEFAKTGANTPARGYQSVKRQVLNLDQAQRIPFLSPNHTAPNVRRDDVLNRSKLINIGIIGHLSFLFARSPIRS